MEKERFHEAHKDIQDNMPEEGKERPDKLPMDGSVPNIARQVLETTTPMKIVDLLETLS